MSKRKVKRQKYLDKLNGVSNPVLIKTWDELMKCKSSKDYYLEPSYLSDRITSGWIKAKDECSEDYGYYLSTHTFYGNQHMYSTIELQKRGFNVIIANWDELGW